jgi:hypothetical protein
LYTWKCGDLIDFLNSLGEFWKLEEGGIYVESVVSVSGLLNYACGFIVGPHLDRHDDKAFDKVMEYKAKGTGFDPRLDHKRHSTVKSNYEFFHVR